MWHYFPRTYKTYAACLRKFQYFTRHQHPDSISTEEVKAYLTHLAVNKKVAASTQNQHFNALLFLFKHILKREKNFSGFEGVPRAEKRFICNLVAWYYLKFTITATG
ncbi:phage integrase N-terminal SAM-like domain-containing protein [bacterium]|nr:phage integrase N-terminal SAM-like domain-containing protein [bacterium]